MNILGIDTNSKGYAAILLPPGAGEPEAFSFVSRDSDPEIRRVEACDAFYNTLVDVSLRPLETMLFCEEPLILPKNWLTTRNLSLAAGALWAVNGRIPSPMTWFWVSVSTWKADVVGSGRANKLEVIGWARAKGVDYPDCVDLYDAFAIANYGQMQMRAKSGTDG